MELKEVFEPVLNFIRNLQKKDKDVASKQAAKDRLKLVLMQDRASVSPDFFELMKQEIIDVIKKYIEIDEDSLEVQLTRGLEAGLEGPALYANIPIKNVKPVAPKNQDDEETEGLDEEQAEKVAEEILNEIEESAKENLETTEKDEKVAEKSISEIEEDKIEEVTSVESEEVESAENVELVKEDTKAPATENEEKKEIKKAPAKKSTTTNKKTTTKKTAAAKKDSKK